jgi:hypothetical protein
MASWPLRNYSDVMITVIHSRSNVRHAYHDSLKALGHEVSVFCSAQQFVYSSEAFESNLFAGRPMRLGVAGVAD